MMIISFVLMILIFDSEVAFPFLCLNRYHNLLKKGNENQTVLKSFYLTF